MSPLLLNTCQERPALASFEQLRVERHVCMLVDGKPEFSVLGSLLCPVLLLVDCFRSLHTQAGFSELLPSCELCGAVRSMGVRITRVRSVTFSTRPSYASMNLSVVLLPSFFSSLVVYFSYLHAQHHWHNAVDLGQSTDAQTLVEPEDVL